MLTELTIPTINTGGQLPSFFSLTLDIKLPRSKVVVEALRKRYIKLEVSNNVLSIPDVVNETASFEEETPRVLTPMQAYELALSTLKSYEDEWNAYIEKEARLLSVFDEED